MDIATGQEKWRFATGKKIKSSPAVANGAVFVGSHDRHLYAVDAESGEEIWRFKTGDRVFGSPLVHEGMVYAGSDDGHLYALE